MDLNIQSAFKLPTITEIFKCINNTGHHYICVSSTFCNNLAIQTFLKLKGSKISCSNQVA